MWVVAPFTEVNSCGEPQFGEMARSNKFQLNPKQNCEPAREEDVQQRVGYTGRKRGLKLEVKDRTVFIVVANVCLIC